MKKENDVIQFPLNEIIDIGGHLFSTKKIKIINTKEDSQECPVWGCMEKRQGLVCKICFYKPDGGMSIVNAVKEAAKKLGVRFPREKIKWLPIKEYYYLVEKITKFLKSNGLQDTIEKTAEKLGAQEEYSDFSYKLLFSAVRAAKNNLGKIKNYTPTRVNDNIFSEIVEEALRYLLKNNLATENDVLSVINPYYPKQKEETLKRAVAKAFNKRSWNSALDAAEKWFADHPKDVYKNVKFLTNRIMEKEKPLCKYGELFKSVNKKAIQIRSENEKKYKVIARDYFLKNHTGHYSPKEITNQLLLNHNDITFGALIDIIGEQFKILKKEQREANLSGRIKEIINAHVLGKRR